MDKSQIQDWERERQEWVAEVGEFILACGEIEARTFEMLDDLLSDEIPGIRKNMKFEQRNQFIRALIETKVADDNLKQLVKDGLSEAQEIMGIRNVIAHNPLDLKIIGDSASISTEQVIRRYYTDGKDKDSKEYTLATLSHEVGRGQLLYSRLGDIAYKLRVYLEQRS